MAYIGTVSKEQEDTITLLKTAVLVTEVLGEDNATLIKLGKEAMIAALNKINSSMAKRSSTTSLAHGCNRLTATRSRKNSYSRIAKTLPSACSIRASNTTP